MKFEIKHRFTGAVLFSLECGSLKICVEAAVKARANLAGANLAGANLAGANLAGAYLAGAYLAGANLARANLARADLARADLADADLTGADLTGADLAGADLAGAYLAGAYLADAYLAGTKQIIAAGFPNGWACWAYQEKDTGLLRVRVGCRDKTLAEGRAYWVGKDDRREVLAALDYIEAVARLRGWNLAGAEQAA